MLLKNQETEFQLVPEGQHLAICYSIIDLGTLPESYQGQAPKPTRKVVFSFEFPNETAIIEAVPQRMRLSEEFTASIGTSSNLRKCLIGWRGQNFTDQEDKEGWDPFQMLGKPCLAQVIHKKAKTSGKERAEIVQFSPVADGTQIPGFENPLIKFSWDHFNRETLMKLPEWIRTKTEQSSQYKTGVNVQMAAEDVNSQEIPVVGEAANQPEPPPPHIASKDDDILPF